MSPVPQVVYELVERFERNREAYRSGQYNEEQVRREFIDPFFKALGWDVDNERGYSEAYKEVVHEESIKIGSATEAPDYTFRIGGLRKFFVEAKKPSVNLKEDISPAYQLRRYAWSAKLPLSILTDFEEFAVYDCRSKPDKADKASTARVMYWVYTQYPTHWEEIAGIFSREAVLKGSFDRYVESAKAMKGTAEVDEAFLESMSQWREALARNLALRNPHLGVRELNYAVQRTLDRIIFLRICEDRGVEPYGRLMALLNGEQVYARLLELYRQADERYNSGLFHFRPEKGRAEEPDELTPGLVLDDKPLKEIIRGLYYPDSPYEFSVIGADILGQVYEQFLGSVIRLTPGHRAVVEQKPEVRKAGGVYYTPQYIVEYIVRHTVGALLEEGLGGGDWGLENPPNPTSQTPHPNSSKENEPHGPQDLPGPGSMAEGRRSGRGGVSFGQELSRRGALRPDEPASARSDLGAGEYRRGVWQDPSGGLPASSIRSARVLDGGGDSSDDRRAPGVRGAGTGLGDVATHAAGGQDAAQAHRLSRQTLAPKPQTLIPIPHTLRILDPACGSGSFLLGAYQYLLDWYLRWYTEHDPESWARKKNPPIRRVAGDAGRGALGPNGTWRLTTSERKRILLEHIYGVDIDPQAVEVTKLNLLLKALEGENDETLTRQLTFFHERALPDLGRNIKCGNSLIGPDYYAAQQGRLFDEEELYRVNPFDWQKEFPEVFSPSGGALRRGVPGNAPTEARGRGEGGFDVVIGNPPYVRQELLGELKAYFQRHYRVYHGVADLYVYFIERGVSLLRPGGLFSYIVANKWLRANYGQPLRRWLKEQEIEEIVDFGDLPVFKAATTYPCILRIRKGVPWNAPTTGAPTFHVAQVETLDFGDLDEYVRRHRYPVNRATLGDGGWALVDERTERLLAKLRAAGVPLGEYVQGRIYRGILTGLNEAFIIDAETRERLIAEDPKSAELIVPFLMGRDIKRYAPPTSERWLIFTRRGVDIKRYPAIERHLAQFKDRLLPKPKGWKGEWHGRKPGAYKWYEIQDTIDYYAEFEKPKIIVPAIVQSATYAFDEAGFYSNDKTSIIPINDLYLLGLLNSKVPDFVMHHISSTKQGGYFEYKPMYISQLPIRTIDFSDPADRARHERMVELVERMLSLHQRLAAAQTPPEKTLLQRQIAATDEQIDRLVYELYNLTEEEIALVEGKS